MSMRPHFVTTVYPSLRVQTGDSANRFTLMTCLVAMTAIEYDALYGRRELRRRLTFQLLLDCLSVCNYCETYCLVMTVHLVGITVVTRQCFSR